MAYVKQNQSGHGQRAVFVFLVMGEYAIKQLIDLFLDNMELYGTEEDDVSGHYTHTLLDPVIVGLGLQRRFV